MSRISIKIAGESGAGLLSTGEILVRSLQAMGFYIFAERENPSVIKGIHACFKIDASTEKIYSLSGNVDIMLSIDKSSLKAYLPDLKENGTLVYGYDRELGIKEQLEYANNKKINLVYLKARELAESLGGNMLMKNIVLLGMLWKTLGFDYKYIEDEVTKKFASKPKLLELDLKCLKAGYEQIKESLKLNQPNKKTSTILMDGNKSIALGAVHAGCRAYFAYPMSPSSSILMHMANWQKKTGMVVKQVEDEIAVANYTLGASYIGTRSMCATSGGGLDLMAETISLSAMIETPLVICIAQRPGPATGLPTWTGQGDLNPAIYSGHGEYAKLVLAVSDPEDAFELTQHAFNYAEKYQIPVILLTEKVIAESSWTIEKFKQNEIEIQRHLVEGKDLESLENSDRYKLTNNGISKRWIPGTSNAYYFANGDEHLEDGSLTEDAEPSKLMIEKRIKKLETLKNDLPEPKIYGEQSADISFIGWGSSRNVMRDVIEEAKKMGIKVNYLHFEYLFPLKETKLKEFISTNKNTHLIEGTYTGQLAELIRQKTGIELKGKLLKWDGRYFTINEVLDYINQQNG